jgi:DNA topoisomerase IB
VRRLCRSDCSGPGITRRRRGKGFEYAEDGERITEPDVIERIRALGIPPAWKDVWICPDEHGHLQATGTDAAGRKQYLYHPRWRERRDAEKFDDMAHFARALPKLRKRVAKDLKGDEVTRERVLGCAVRLLDRGFFRIGSEEYTVQNESYGLATMRKAHVSIEGDCEMVFDYPAKSGQRRVQAVMDKEACAVVTQLKRRRGGGDELLAYKNGRRWHDVRSEEINAYIKDATSEEFSAKDFRTWNATVLAAVALSVSGQVAGSKTGRKRAITRAIKEVAYYLGNTPAVCRASYIDPRVFDAYRAGLVIAHPVEGRRALEEAVLDLINERERSPALEKIAA